jgi:hypothetical protein
MQNCEEEMMGIWSIIGPYGAEVSLRDIGVQMRDATGAGVPPIHNVTLQSASDAGGIYQRSLATMRTIELRLVPRQRYATLAAIRLELLAALNPDLVSDECPAYLRYQGGSKTLRLPVVYAGGLDDSDNDDALDLRFLAYDPVWTATTAATAVALIEQVGLNGGYVFQRAGSGSDIGTWKALGSLNNDVMALLVGHDGTLYAGGRFTGPPDYFARWDDTLPTPAWVAVSGTGTPPNFNVFAIANGPGTTLYLGGTFSGRVKKWDGAAWSNLTLTDALDVQALVVGDDGTLYAGGNFSAGEHIAAYANGSGWSSLGSGVSLSVGVPYVYALARGTDGKIYVGGNFDSPANHVARWNPATATWENLGSGLDGIVHALLFLPDGRLVAGGSFTGNVAVWNGVVWETLGSLAGGSVLCLAVRSDGLLYAGGGFDEADGLALPNTQAQWNGYAWFPLDVKLPSGTTAEVLTIVVDSAGTLSVGYHGAGSTGSRAGVVAVANEGTAAAYPIVEVQGPGRFYELANWTTGDIIYFDLVLQTGETLTLDLRPGIKSVVSSFRGNVIGQVVPGSKLATWRLMPGTNRVALYMQETTGATAATITWHERHWSLDAA